MPKITKISPQVQNPDRVTIYIDGVYCTGVRSRTFKGMNLSVGSEITCDELKKLESFYWKKSYGEDAWKKEKIRTKAVKSLIESFHPELLVNIVGFGADTDEFIEKHPDEKGKPDLDISTKSDPKKILVKVEVTGTEIMRGEGFWVRPDKLEYSENHPDEDVWIVLHFAQPNETFIFIKPIQKKTYKREVIQIYEADEHMCIFNNGDPELHSQEQFKDHLFNKFNLEL